MKLIKLGSLNISEDKIVVADPSYNYGDCGTVLLKKVLSGKYLASVTNADSLITSLKICHSDYKNCDLNFERYRFIAVDSGQAGFFDKDYFVKNQGGTFGDLNSFYGLACSITMSPKQAGTIHKKGVVSSSGFGDGCYNLFVAKNSTNKIVSAFIEFISNFELEELE